MHSFKFLGYKQSPGIDPQIVESTLDRVYEVIIQSALRARAKQALDAAAS